MKNIIYVVLLFLSTFLFVGCSNDNIATKQSQEVLPKYITDDLGDVVLKDKDIEIRIGALYGNRVDMFNNKFINDSLKKRYVVFSVTVYNKGKKNLYISPDFITAVSDRNEAYKNTAQVPLCKPEDKFPAISIPPDSEKSGEVAFLLPGDQLINRINYSDIDGHNYNINNDFIDTMAKFFKDELSPIK